MTALLAPEAVADYRAPAKSPSDFATDPEAFARFQPFYHGIGAIQPGYLLGEYHNPYRGGQSVYLVDRSDRFNGIYMPTRSGKGVSFAIPNGLTWPHSLFLTDPKKENGAAIAWWRKYGLGQRIFFIDPMAIDGRNSRFDPLSEIRVRTDFEVTDTQNIATAIVDPDGAGFEGDSGVWKARARDFLTGLILHVLYSPTYKEKSLRIIAAILRDPDAGIKRKLIDIKEAIHDPQGKFGWRNPANGRAMRTHPMVAMCMQGQLDRPDGEAGSVKSETERYIEAYLNNTLGENSSVSDFSIADFMRGPVPATIILGVTADNMEICKPYVRLLLNLLINRNVGPLSFDRDARPIKPYNFKGAMILDEFTSVYGNLRIFSQQLAFIAGFGFKPSIVVQDLEQLIETYGQHQNITSNIGTTIFSAMNHYGTAEAFSRLLGNRTYYSERRSRSRGVTTISEDVGQAPLLTPRQIMKMPYSEAVCVPAHADGIPLKKLAYYQDDTAFKQLVRPPDFPGDRLRPEQQAGWDDRQAAERAYLDKAKANSYETTITVTRAPTTSEAKASDAVKELFERSYGPATGPSMDDDGSV